MSIKSDGHFIRNLFRSSGKSLIIALLIIVFLIGLDYFGRFLFHFMLASDVLWVNKTSLLIEKLNNIWGPKYVEFFKDVIVIVAGILGVILGLFFTTFINIISTKYAHVNTIITQQILEQKITTVHLK